jgi:Flp pilus assembly protein TadG
MRLVGWFRRQAAHFARDQHGIALIEFAAVLPVLVTMFFGCFELARYGLANLKVDRVAGSTGDLVAQLDVVTTGQLTDLYNSGRDIMEPFDLQGEGRVIISSVHRPTNAAATVAWQSNDGGALAEASRIGTTGNAATLPPGFTLAVGADIIVAEAFYRYTPTLASDWFGTTTFYRVHFYRPRGQDPLDTLN